MLPLTQSGLTKPLRNDTVDIIRGFAMLMVVLQHTIAGCTADFGDTTLL